MATYTVTGARRETALDGSHRHVEDVCTDAGIHYTRREVAESLARGDDWRTSAEGRTAPIETVTYCPAPGCLVTPYLRTHADATAANNLECLPDC